MPNIVREEELLGSEKTRFLLVSTCSSSICLLPEYTINYHMNNHDDEVMNYIFSLLILFRNSIFEVLCHLLYLISDSNNIVMPPYSSRTLGKNCRVSNLTREISLSASLNAWHKEEPLHLPPSLEETRER